MFCKNCGLEVNEGSAFCQECGEKVDSIPEVAPVNYAEPVNPSPVPPASPVYAQPVAPQPVYAVPAMPKKKSHIGRWIFLTVLVLLLGAGLFIYGQISWFGPKDLGVRYTQKDYNSAVQKLGIHITADLGNGTTYDNKDILAGSETATGYGSANNSTAVKVGDLNFKDYNWEFTNYVRKTVRLTNVEVTAFFNEIAPSFWWFKNTQVKIAPDGTIITSSSANIKKMKENLFSDVAGKIPVPLPDKVNLYTEGDFSVTNNKINMNPEVMNTGAISLPKEFKSGSNLNTFSSYLERFYTTIPNLSITNAGVENGEFVFDGNIPTEVKVTPKK